MKTKYRDPESKWKFVKEAASSTKGECIEWPWGQAAGYGAVMHPETLKQVRTHRAALALKLGRPVTPSLLALHSCNNRLCLNGSHLHEGDHNGRPARTQCVRGHEYNEENTYTSPQGVRSCRVCRRHQRRN